MFDPVLFVFLLFAIMGAAVQTMTGFGMGIIIVSGITATGTADIGFTASVVGLLTLANALLSLRNSHQFINLNYLKNILIGLLPCLLAGVVLLQYMEEEFYCLLKIFLGVVTIIASLSLILKAKPTKSLLGTPFAIFFGSCSGIISGLYGAGGPPVAYFMYRQPIKLDTIRATLLAVFSTTLIFRSIFVFLDGGFTQGVLLTSGVIIPIVIFTTVLTGKINHLVPGKIIKTIVSFILIFTGSFLIATAV